MLEIFNGIRDFNLVGIVIRICMASFCSGIIGIERTYKRRAAGFRTHILICLGACLAAMTGQFFGLYMNMYTDMTRLGAQVIAGIGFIGAGAIITTPRKQVKGLTTAAGLWTTAVMGLCFGAGFYEAGIIASIMILTVETFFSRIEYRINVYSPEINLYFEYYGKNCIQEVQHYLKEKNINIINMEIDRITKAERGEKRMCAFLQLRLEREQKLEPIIAAIMAVRGVSVVEEL